MKNKTLKLIMLLLAGCLILGGCGAKASPTNAAQEENQSTDTTPPDTSASDVSADASLDVAAPVNDLQPADVTASELPAADTSAETETPAETVRPTGEEHTIVGIVTDATKYSLAIQVPDGTPYSLTIPESGLEGNLNYLTVGQLATLTYVGSLDENHAYLVGISDSSMITGIYLEEYAFAIKIINAVREMNLQSLSDLTNFPVFLETEKYSGSIDTSGEFEAIDNEKIFTEALSQRISNYNLFDLEYTDSGFVMGKGTPSITFDVDDDGILGIIGINCNAPTKEEN